MFIENKFKDCIKGNIKRYSYALILKMNRKNQEHNFLYELVFLAKLFGNNDLPARNLMVLEMRWKYNYSFGIIGKQLNVSEQRASQIYQASLNKLLSILTSFFESQKKEGKIIANTNETLINTLPNFNPKVKAELFRLNIHTLKQLSLYKKKDLMMYKRIGKKTIDYIDQVLQDHHLAFLDN
jgi:hypothetical protein